MSTPITTMSATSEPIPSKHSKRKREWCGDQEGIDEGGGVTPQDDDQPPKRLRSRRPVAIAPWPPVAGNNSSNPLPQQSFTFVSNPERFSLASNRPPLVDLTDEINLTPCGSSHDRHTARLTSSEAGPSTADLRKSLVAFDISSDRSKLNREYGFCKSKKYFFTSPLSPDPKRRKKSKSHMRRAKKSSNSLLKAALERNLSFSLQKRKDLYYTPRSDSVPLLDEDDDDEFDDDEEDEIIDFDDDNESQLTDIVSMYTRETTPEPDLACEAPCNHGEAIVVEEGGIKCIVAASIPITHPVAKSAPVGKPATAPPSHSHSIPLLRSLGRSWSPNSLIPSLVSSKAMPAFPVTI